MVFTLHSSSTQTHNFILTLSLSHEFTINSIHISLSRFTNTRFRSKIRRIKKKKIVTEKLEESKTETYQLTMHERTLRHNTSAVRADSSSRAFLQRLAIPHFSSSTQRFDSRFRSSLFIDRYTAHHHQEPSTKFVEARNS